MAHSQTVRIINHYATDALKQKDPMVFLQDLGPLHDRWHSTSLRNNLGFLLFHWHVVTAFKKCHADKVWPGGVQPFSSADWNQFGWPYNLALNVNEGAFDSLVAFSSGIESWHNEAHMAVQMATGEDMMDPATNIFLRNFWRLHYFIDVRFLEALDAFDGIGAVKAQVSRLEKKHEGHLGEV